MELMSRCEPSDPRTCEAVSAMLDICTYLVGRPSFTCSLIKSEQVLARGVTWHFLYGVHNIRWQVEELARDIGSLMGPNQR
eukprot:44713-Eustigmatos_ZCMA.PRE.1